MSGFMFLKIIKVLFGVDAVGAISVLYMESVSSSFKHTGTLKIMHVFSFRLINLFTL